MFCDGPAGNLAGKCGSASEPRNQASPANGTRLEIITFITPGKIPRQIAYKTVEIHGLGCGWVEVVGQIAQISDSVLGTVTNVGQNPWF